MGTWIDFRELRAKLRFADVLRFYNVELKVKGDQATGYCPLPGHRSRREGKRRSPSFSVHLGKGIFQCFSCGAGGRGNVIDFAVLMDGLDPRDPQQVRTTAIKLQEHFCQPSTPVESHPPAPAARKLPAVVHAGDKTIINAPLDFELKHLKPSHPYLTARGLRPETIEHFGLGFCDKGLMKDRIAIPLHDPQGQLIGYAGRLVDDSQISSEIPKYRLPGLRQHGGISYEFRKSLLLYNAHRLEPPIADLIVVEGFASVWHLFQRGIENVVALMGASCSVEQGTLIRDLIAPGGHVWIFADGDAAGERLAHEFLTLVAPDCLVGWVKLFDGCQPTDCEEDELADLLNRCAEKSGRSERPLVAPPASKSNTKARDRGPPELENTRTLILG